MTQAEIKDDRNISGLVQCPCGLVVCESPFWSEDQLTLDRNVLYARRVLRHSLDLGETPFMGHLLYTQVYDDKITFERKAGIEAHCNMIKRADLVRFYADYDLSPGMREAWAFACSVGAAVHIWFIGTNDHPIDHASARSFNPDLLSRLGMIR